MHTITKFHRALVWLISALTYCGVVSTEAQAQTGPTWTDVQRTTSTGTGSTASGQSLAIAPDGSRYVTGLFIGTLTLGTTTLTGVSTVGHVFLAKYSTAGKVLWATQLDGRGLSTRIAVDATGNAYLTGTFVSTVTLGSTSLTTATLTTPGAFDAYLVKYDAQGVRQWVKQGGGDSVESYAIAVDTNNNVILTGDCENAVSFGGPPIGTVNGGTYKAFYYKFTPAGDILQAKQVSAASDVNVTSVALDGANNVYLAGQFSGSPTFGTTTLQVNGVNSDLFLCKLDANGTVLWAQRDGSPGYDLAESVAVDVTGSPVLCGHYNLTSNASGSGTTTIYVARFTAQGALVWNSQVPLGGARFENSAHGITCDNKGGYLVTGSFVGTAVFNTTTLTAESARAQLFIARYDRQGTVLWAQKVTGTTASTINSSGNYLLVDASGTGYLTGSLMGAATFGTLPTVTSSVAGASDSFIATFTLGSTLATNNPTSPGLALQVFPNPAAGEVLLQLPLAGGTIVVLDELGRTVSRHVVPASADVYRLSLAGLTPGLYHVLATFGNGQSARTQLSVK